MRQYEIHRSIVTSPSLKGARRLIIVNNHRDAVLFAASLQRIDTRRFSESSERRKKFSQQLQTAIRIIVSRGWNNNDYPPWGRYLASSKNNSHFPMGEFTARTNFHEFVLLGSASKPANNIEAWPGLCNSGPLKTSPEPSFKSLFPVSKI